jgi:transcriptional regulator with XRE-family HTH domain/DNA polymerase III delta prime subunit
MSHNKGMKPIQSNQLRQEREMRGWSRAYIAEQVGVDVASVGRWERGERLPHPHHRQKLCALFEKSALDLGFLSEPTVVYDDVPPAPDLQEQGVLFNKQETTPPLITEQSVSISQPDEVSPVSLEVLSVEDELSTSKALTSMNQQNREKMLRKMHAFWIDGVLEQSLRATGPIPLELKEQYDAVTDPWALTLQRAEALSFPLPSYIHIGQTYDEANGELLILGEPGSGKTTLLLELARILLERATQKGTHPIPLVFNLASWAIKRQSLSNWLIEELRSKYQVPRKLAQNWVQMEQILPLLDGLDEVIASARSACIEAINAYRREHGLQPMVICSRVSDYFMQSSRLLLRRAVTVQHLSIATVEEYLVHAGDELAALHRTLQEDPTLLELATSPLLLNILALTYQNRTVHTLAEPHSLERCRNEVFANYVEHMLTRRKGYYTAERTLHWLSWLARQQVQKQQTEFYLEKYALVRPNEGIHRSMRNGVIIGLPVGMTLFCFTLGLILWLDPTHISDGLLWSFPLSLIVTSILVLLNGGYACLQHAVLRCVLRLQGDIPWNYSRFLDEAAAQMLLRKVGGGYIFIHRLLLEYFASYDTRPHEKDRLSKAWYGKKAAAKRIFYGRRK